MLVRAPVYLVLKTDCSEIRYLHSEFVENEQNCQSIGYNNTIHEAAMRRFGFPVHRLLRKGGFPHSGDRVITALYDVISGIKFCLYKSKC